MIHEIFRTFKENPAYNKLIGEGYMILEYKCPVETEIFRLITENDFITYIISGKKDWMTPTKTYQVKDGDAIFVKKGIHTTRQYFEEDHCVMLFMMDDDFIKNFMIENMPGVSWQNGVEQDTIFQLDVDDSLKSLFYSVYNYLKSAPVIPKNLVEIKFKELLFNIVLNDKHKTLVEYFSTLGHSGKTNFDHVMNKNFQHDIPLEDFARLCGRSISTFKRDFKSFYNQSPGKWLNEKRLEYARTLLLTSDLNVNEVCTESGFKNASHFNKAFKEKYQVPPRQFRELSKKG